jgi:anti-sigma factor RsiW
MRETDYITLDLYLDGELPDAEKAVLEERLVSDLTLAQALAHLKQARVLRLAALQTYVPDAAESHRMAEQAMAFCRENQYSPIGRILESNASTIWLKRLGMAAACLLIAVGSYWAGRGSVSSTSRAALAPASSSIIGYTVQISTPSGQVVSQTFATYQQAKAFAQTYTADEQAVSNQSTAAPQVASASNTGVF